jgi:hypothetical protein
LKLATLPIKLFHASHSPWKSQKKRFHTFPPHDDRDVSTGHFNFAQLATFQLCSNKIAGPQLLLRFLLQLGYFGPVLMGALDSSFLFLPFGNDLLVVTLVARNHHGCLGMYLGRLSDPPLASLCLPW